MDNPGAMAPPIYSPFFEIRSIVVAVPKSIARSISFALRLQWNHISGVNIFQVSVVVFKLQCAISRYATCSTDENLVKQLDSHTPATQMKIRFPSRPQRFETRFFKLS